MEPQNGKEFSFDQDGAHRVQPWLYRTPTGYLWGVLDLKEDTPAILPKNPSISADEPIVHWELAFLAKRGRKCISSVDYYIALRRLKPFIESSSHDSILVRGLTKQEWLDCIWGLRWWEEYAQLDLYGGRLEAISDDDQDMLEIWYSDGGLVDVGYLSHEKRYCITAVVSDDEVGWVSPFSEVYVTDRDQLAINLQAVIKKFREGI